MPNLPVPTLPTEVPGNYMTSALQNTIGVNGLGFILNAPIAELYQTATQSLATSTNTAITFDSSSVDSYGGHSNVTNNSRYVGQVPGYYLVLGIIVYASNATGFRAATIAKNGSLTAVNGGFGIAAPVSGAVTCAQATAVVQLNGSTDYIELYGDQNSGGPLSTAVAATIQQSAMTIWWMHS